MVCHNSAEAAKDAASRQDAVDYLTGELDRIAAARTKTSTALKAATTEKAKKRLEADLAGHTGVALSIATSFTRRWRIHRPGNFHNESRQPPGSRKSSATRTSHCDSSGSPERQSNGNRPDGGRSLSRALTLETSAAIYRTGLSKRRAPALPYRGRTRRSVFSSAHKP